MAPVVSYEPDDDNQRWSDASVHDRGRQVSGEVVKIDVTLTVVK
jgi:hypothetical protein